MTAPEKKILKEKGFTEAKHYDCELFQKDLNEPNKIVQVIKTGFRSFKVYTYELSGTTEIESVLDIQ